MSEFCIVYTSTASEAEAQLVADTLVSEHLAACVSRLGPSFSTYRWQGQIQHDQEYVLMIKTRRSLVDRLSQRIQELHSYDVPEVFVVPVVGGADNYLEWLGQETEHA